VVVGLVAGVAYLLLSSPLTVVRQVQVTGNGDVPAQVVLRAAAVPLGEPMVRLDGAAVQRRVLATVANVGSVSVQRHWPSTVRLVLTGRVVALVVPQDGQFLLVDRAGVAYRLTPKPPQGVVAAALADPGPDDAATRAVLAVLHGLPRDLRQRVQRVAAPTPDQVTLLLRDGRAVLWGGVSDGPAKAAVVRILLRRPGRHIDVSAPGLVTVR